MKTPLVTLQKDQPVQPDKLGNLPRHRRIPPVKLRTKDTVPTPPDPEGERDDLREARDRSVSSEVPPGTDPITGDRPPHDGVPESMEEILEGAHGRVRTQHPPTESQQGAASETTADDQSEEAQKAFNLDKAEQKDANEHTDHDEPADEGK